MSGFDHNEKDKSNVVLFPRYTEDYSWIDELAGTIDDHLKSASIPDHMIRELSEISVSLTELYNDSCSREL